MADAKIAFEQLTEAIKGKVSPASYETWRERLRSRNVQKQAEAEQALSNNASPIHPLRLCKEVRDFIDRDAVLCVDGQETLNYARQAIPQYTARHRINSGAYGTMGVGMPFGVGAKVALPDKQVVVLHGDGSWGMNSMEFDTACRHKLPILVIISQNGGWTGDPGQETSLAAISAIRATKSSPSASAGMASTSKRPRTSGQRSSARRRRSLPASRRSSASSPTGRPAPRRRRSRATRPNG